MKSLSFVRLKTSSLHVCHQPLYVTKGFTSYDCKMEILIDSANQHHYPSIHVIDIVTNDS